MSRAALVLHAALCIACTERVVGGLEEPEANRILTALEQAGIPATKSAERHGRDTTWTVKVGPEDAGRARGVMASLSLPRPAARGLDEIVGEDSIVPSASRERLRETVARGREIARTLETLEGVVQATVIIAPAETPGLGAAPCEKSTPGTASALIKVNRDLAVSTEQVQRLVAGAVQGIEPEGVTVVIARAPASTRSQPAWASLGPFVVSPSSRPGLMAALAVMALLNVLLGGWAVTSAVLLRRARRPAGSPG